VPKAFDESEKAAIRTAMKRAGLKHFQRAGVRAARVDDICRAVGIAKGSFYAFFPSKEELFMTIVEEREDQHKFDTFAFLATAGGTPSERAGALFDLILGKIETDPVLNLVLANGEIPHLIRKLGAGRFATGHDKDRQFAEEAAVRWGHAGGSAIRPEDLLGLMTIALALAAQRAQMTDAQYRPTVALMRELFIDRLVEARK
jgi:AcrR family transcriptional regulator